MSLGNAAAEAGRTGQFKLPLARPKRTARGGFTVLAVLLLAGKLGHGGVQFDREAVPLGVVLQKRKELVARQFTVGF